MQGFNLTTSGIRTVSPSVRIVNDFPFHRIQVLLYYNYKTQAIRHCVIYLGKKVNSHPPPPKSEGAHACKDLGSPRMTKQIKMFRRHFQRSNSTLDSLIQTTVQTVMNLLGKAEASGQDPYLALLTYHSTPIDNNLPSPAQLLNHRDYPTQLPISGRLQHSQALASHREQLQNRQNIQRKQYDSRSTQKTSKTYISR